VNEERRKKANGKRSKKIVSAVHTRQSRQKLHCSQGASTMFPFVFCLKEQMNERVSKATSLLGTENIQHDVQRRHRFGVFRVQTFSRRPRPLHFVMPAR
jgi:hypothetical protein